MTEQLAELLVAQLGGKIERHALSKRAPGAAVRLRIGVALPTSGASRTPTFKLVSDRKNCAITSTFIAFPTTATAQRAWERASKHVQQNRLPIKVSISSLKRECVVLNVFDRKVARDWSAAIKRPLRGL